MRNRHGVRRLASSSDTRTGPKNGMLSSTWVAGSAFTVNAARRRIAPGETAEITISFAPGTAAEQKGYLQILSDDPQAPLRSAYLVGNRPGLGVGMELPETRAVLLDGREWTSTEARGTVTLLAFFATF